MAPLPRFPAKKGGQTGLEKVCVWLTSRHGEGLTQDVARTRKFPEGLTLLPAHLAGHCANLSRPPEG